MDIPTGQRFGGMLPVAAAAFGLCLIAVHVQLLPLETIDQTAYLLPWLAHAEKFGRGYLTASFTNYTPFYEHVLAFLALLPGPPLLRIKLFSIFFNIILGLTVAALVPAGRGLLAFFITVSLPTVVMNAAMLGQSDAIYTTPVVVSLLLSRWNKPAAAMLAMSLGIAIKLQAAMFLPFFVLLWFERRQPTWTFLLLPVCYVLMALPMLASGRPLHEITNVYVQQFDTFKWLTMHAPNMWAVLQRFMDYETGIAVGLPLAIGIVAAMVLTLARTEIIRSAEGMMLAAALVLLMVPYVTPKMHDRYFFMLDPILVALACSYPKYIFPMVCAQLASFFSYMPFMMILYGTENWFFGEDGVLARLSLRSGFFTALSVGFMTLALIAMVYRARQLTASNGGSLKSLRQVLADRFRLSPVLG